MATTTLHLTELGCASCIIDIEGALEAIPGVTRAEVHTGRQEVIVDHGPAVTSETLTSALAAAGHPIDTTG